MKKYTFLFIAVTFLLYSHFLILYGALKERKRKICIDPVVETKFNKIVADTQAICVDLSTERLKEVDKEIEKQKQAAAYWQKKYNSTIIIPTTTPL